MDNVDLPISLAGYTASMQVRETYKSKTYLIQLDTILGITIVGNAIEVVIDWTTTSLFAAANYVWDIEITAPDGTRSRVLEGKFIVTPSVTR
jgi:hypothetical protein